MDSSFAAARKLAQLTLEDELYKGRIYSVDVAATISERVVMGLKDLSSSYKYIVSTVVLQNSGGGLQCANCQHWDPQVDGGIAVRFETPTLVAICCVWLVSLS